MNPADVYRLAMPMSHRVLVIAGMVAMSLFGLVLLVMTLSSSGAWFPFMLMWCAALWWNWSIVLGIPYEIRFDAPGRVSFVALRGTTSLSAAQLHSLKPYGVASGSTSCATREARFA
jgi:hypothetical protein